MEQIHDLVVRAANAPSLNERVEAYGRLVECFRDMACGYAYSVLGDFHLAEDVAQEAFIVAFGKLRQLEEPAAFPGWFRRIVWSACGRTTRRKSLPTAGLEAAAGIAAPTAGPHEIAEQNEMRDEVLKAIRQLPAPEREVTALFYINGYSQKDISEFLEVPVTTVKNRLNASRSRLKERMMRMVKDTMQKNAPDERFDQGVIASLLAKPNLLQVEGHPVQQTLAAIRQELSEFEFMEAKEVVDLPARATKASLSQAYHVDDSRILSYETTISVLQAASRRMLPVRLIAAGRSFRAIGEGPRHCKAFHQVDALCVEAGASAKQCIVLLQRALGAALGSSDFTPGDVVPLWYATEYREVKVASRAGLITVGGYGMLSTEAVADLGFDSKAVAGYAIDFGLDRLAGLKHGVEDIREFGRPPYAP